MTQLKPLLCNLTILALLAFSSNQAFAQSEETTPDPKQLENAPATNKMTLEKMISIIKQIAKEVEVDQGNLTFEYDGSTLAIISDTNANRMRIVSPVIEASQMSEEQVVATLISNYHLALDARYAIGNGILYSVYVHSLEELTETMLKSAVRQVATLRKTFGNGYTSGEFSFGINAEEERVDI